MKTINKFINEQLITEAKIKFDWGKELPILQKFFKSHNWEKEINKLKHGGYGDLPDVEDVIKNILDGDEPYAVYATDETDDIMLLAGYIDNVDDKFVQQWDKKDIKAWDKLSSKISKYDSQYNTWYD